MSTPEVATLRPTISVWRDRLTGRIQLEISEGGAGYRIAGPKFIGDSDLLLRHVLNERDAKEIADVLVHVGADDERSDGDPS